MHIKHHRMSHLEGDSSFIIQSRMLTSVQTSNITEYQEMKKGSKGRLYMD